MDSRPQVKKLFRPEGFWSCTKCGLLALLEDAHEFFYKRCDRKTYRPICKQCSINAVSKWKATHPARARKARADRYQRDKVSGKEKKNRRRWQKRRNKKVYALAKQILFSDKPLKVNPKLKSQVETFAVVMIRDKAKRFLAKRQRELRERG